MLENLVQVLCSYFLARLVNWLGFTVFEKARLSSWLDFENVEKLGSTRLVDSLARVSLLLENFWLDQALLITQRNCIVTFSFDSL